MRFVESVFWKSLENVTRNRVNFIYIQIGEAAVGYLLPVEVYIYVSWNLTETVKVNGLLSAEWVELWIAHCSYAWRASSAFCRHRWEGIRLCVDAWLLPQLGLSHDCAFGTDLLLSFREFLAKARQWTLLGNYRRREAAAFSAGDVTFLDEFVPW